MFSKDYTDGFGTTTEADAEPQIHQKLIDIRRLVGSLKSEKKPGVPFKVKSSQVLGLKFREALDTTGCNARLVRVEANALPTIPAVQATYDAEGVSNEDDQDAVFCAQATVTYRITAPDGSYADFQGFGMGTASDDKCAGKAVTYAQKCAVVYALNLPDADMPDADDEVTRHKATAKAAVVTSAKTLAVMTAAIAACKTVPELTALRADLVKLPKDEQAKLTGPYTERLATIKNQAASAGEPEAGSEGPEL